LSITITILKRLMAASASLEAPSRSSGASWQGVTDL
jgi:hypothetical protein